MGDEVQNHWKNGVREGGLVTGTSLVKLWGGMYIFVLNNVKKDKIIFRRLECDCKLGLIQQVNSVNTYNSDCFSYGK